MGRFWTQGCFFYKSFICAHLIPDYSYCLNISSSDWHSESLKVHLSTVMNNMTTISTLRECFRPFIVILVDPDDWIPCFCSCNTAVIPPLCFVISGFLINYCVLLCRDGGHSKQRKCFWLEMENVATSHAGSTEAGRIIGHLWVSCWWMCLPSGCSTRLLFFFFVRDFH